VSCELTRTVLHGYLDGELDAARAAEFEHHLESCSACLAAFEAQESLRSSLHRARLYETAPASLQQKLYAALAEGSPKSSRRIAFPQSWLAIAAASDQHTVKPWFDGKLDFAPPVKDFAESGFPLQGGRLEILHGRSVAALVYGRRKHEVNLFVWPSQAAEVRPHSGTQLGYQWLRWRKNGMEYWLVSDTAAEDLVALQRLLSQ